jgi:hypothetical protein
LYAARDGLDADRPLDDEGDIEFGVLDGMKPRVPIVRG